MYYYERCINGGNIGEKSILDSKCIIVIHSHWELFLMYIHRCKEDLRQLYWAFWFHWKFQVLNVCCCCHLFACFCLSLYISHCFRSFNNHPHLFCFWSSHLSSGSTASSDFCYFMLGTFISTASIITIGTSSITFSVF